MKCECCDAPLMAITHDYVWFECGWVTNHSGGLVFPCERSNMEVHYCPADRGAMMSFADWLTKKNQIVPK